MARATFYSLNIRSYSMCKTYKNESWLMLIVNTFFPQGEIGEDNDGQVVIYTSMTMDKEGTLTLMGESE